MLDPSEFVEQLKLVATTLQHVAAPLKVIATLVDEMKECKELCAHVHKRMVVINDKLLVMETQKTLPPDAVVCDYGSLVTDFQAFLTKHKSRPWVYRVCASRRVIGKVKNFQERINTLMMALDVIHISAMAGERAQQERFRTEQERAIAARLTNDAAVTKAVARVEQQFEALNVLIHELRKLDGLSAATSAVTSAGAAADANEPVATAADRRLLVTALDKVIRRSSVQVDKVPEWFCSPQDVEYETDAFAGGSFGTVHNGRMHGMDVVVKCLLVDTRGNANATKQFRDEATLWFGFRHHHVLLMYSACDVSSPPFVVCELAANGNLRDFLSFEHNVPHTFRLLHQAALGLAYLHTNRVVHGDLKGDNILVSADKSAKIADFSFSYVRAMSASRYSVAQSTAAGGGSRRADAIRWRAPECLQGRSPTFASDVFSFGMCILEVVSQVVPWGYYVDDGSVRDLVMSGKMPERPSDMTDRVWNLVTRMCSLEPGDRPSLSAVTAELSELMEDASTKSLEEAITTDDAACATSMLSSAASISKMVDGWDAPPLVVAAATGATEVTKMLLARGADASALLTTTSPKLQDLDDIGFTALHVAARAGYVSIVKALLAAKPDMVGVRTTKQRSALHYAVQFGHVAVIDELLRNGARVNELSKDGDTPLHWSAFYGQVECARVLLEHKANVHAKRSNDGLTALHQAAAEGHVDLLEELFRHGARVDELSKNGDTPLHWSAFYGQVDSVLILLAHKASVHAKRSSDGATALHRAVANGHVKIARFLLAAGAEVIQADVEAAQKYGHSELVRLLQPLAALR